jgi:hypothetical protein
MLLRSYQKDAMARKIRIDMTGLRFGRLVGLEHAFSRHGHAHWLFLCDCGTQIVTNGTSVRAGKTSSCGCLHRERSAARLTTHGHRAGKRHDATYRAWQAMNDACFNPASSKFRECGALGTGVCAVWRSDFEAFLDDMGERPAGSVLGRIDRDHDFGPGNCRWAAIRSRTRRAIDGWQRQPNRVARSPISARQSGRSA